ncbi:hypothetical protein C5167_034344 [Papaver somniferum]|uniref:Uncharacterized protein n=1 Tax=Papaver somniferum TaxID=3469 RepID=A0A4Y7KE93_PAPSO|nr:hypothetical protein C5167_034344 [Papaver somniferum]
MILVPQRRWRIKAYSSTVSSPSPGVDLETLGAAFLRKIVAVLKKLLISYGKVVGLKTGVLNHMYHNVWSGRSDLQLEF